MSNQTQESFPREEKAPVPAAAAPFRSLRVWPALTLIVLMVAARFGPALVEGGSSEYWFVSVFGPTFCCLLIVIWWLSASRATWKERLFGFVGIIVSLVVTVALVHPTMRGAGTNYLTLPIGMFAFGLAATLLRERPPGKRTRNAVLAAFCGFASTALIRNEGMSGDYVMTLRPRWSQTTEAAMLASHKPSANTGIPATGKAEFARAEWPAFRGTDRSGRVVGPKISTNLASPKQLWKIAVGPAWSSFSVAGDLLFTQEQRGPMEAVVCYDAQTGREVWNQQTEGRLEDPLGGPGPRATPTISTDALFVTGPTGFFGRLDPRTGKVIWKQDLKTLAGRAAPMWGFAASPLVVGSNVVVYAGGTGDKAVFAFDTGSGAVRWSAPAGFDSYSSPQLNTIEGEPVVLMLSNEGLLFLEPATGKIRLNYAWKCMGYRALQPLLIAEDTILISTPMSIGTRAIHIEKKDGSLSATELWTSRLLKPDFTDFVVYQGHAYGVDGGFFICIDLKTGERKWKGGRYGKGEVVLLESSGLLLVSTEPGDVVLVKADPSASIELASFKALEGKTWNHPVVVGDRLYIRNSQEAAAYQLPLAEPKTVMNSGFVRQD